MTILQDIYYKYKRDNRIDNLIIQHFVDHTHGMLNHKKRWTTYHQYITNDFINDNTKQHIISIYGKYISFIVNIHKWIGRYKKQKAKIYNHTDLYGACLREFDSSEIICLYENKTNYLFTIQDLKSLFYHALTHNIDETMFINPLHPRNPHTNLAFSKASLLKIKQTFNTRPVFSTPRVIYSYFRHDYNLDLVYEENRYYLNMLSVKTFMKSCVTTKKKCIKLLKIIYLFTGYRLNEITCRQMISFKYPINDVYNKKRIHIDENFQTILIECGNDILTNYYYYIFYNDNIDRYKINVLKTKIRKYIPISKYFDAVSDTFKLRQRQVIDKKFLDYMAVYYMNPFLYNGRDRRKYLANIRMCIRCELDWYSVEICRINNEGQDDDSSEDDSSISI